MLPVQQLFRFKRNISAGSLTNLTLPIATIASEIYWEELGMRPVITGTTFGRAYEHDHDHLNGCAIDFRTRSLTFEEQMRVSQRIAARLHSEVSKNARVVLWYQHDLRPDHMHVTIQECGAPHPEEPLKAMWSWNQKEMLH